MKRKIMTRFLGFTLVFFFSEVNSAVSRTRSLADRIHLMAAVRAPVFAD